MPSNRRVTVYGAYGHTGRFVVDEMIKRGWAPILSGRDADKLKLAGANFPNLEVRCASVEHLESLDYALADAAAVINCAGPFAKTSEPVIEAALRRKIPYLDLAAEVEVAASVFEKYENRAREAKIVIVPSIAFYGGLGDLLATVAMGKWQAVDEIRLAYALDTWKPTTGTTNTIQTSTKRRHGQRIVYSKGRMEFRTDEAPVSDWEFPAPFGTQRVVGEFTTADSVTIPRHLKAAELKTFMTLAPLKDLSDPDLSPPPAVDERGRSAQKFLVEVVALLGSSERRAIASGRDIYAVSAPLAVEAAERVIDNPNHRSGVFAAGEIFDASDFLMSLSPEH